MASSNEKHHPIVQGTEVDRVEEAFEKLQITWRAVRTRIYPNGRLLVDEATLKELDAAEQEWLAVRPNVSMGS